ncbi:YciI family protein [Stenotrophomonas sp. Marseille-Q4652]|uniref:YciI family protein n=1 Tax=Stenotrophomonas sp. Marseille-Q4652 TaxID=2866595 RepID=UPI001CE427D7|nr:YciI family protein [Stenotrophomonas sp. Marseille-Q4652]
MQFLMTINIDPELVQAAPAAEYDELMRGCLRHADELKAQGVLLASQQLEPPATARTLRTRDRQTRITDGPFAESREILAGFNLIQARDIDEAVRIAHGFPWSRFGSIEVRPVHDMDAERARVGA